MGHLPARKPTSFDIAYLAGVSQPTVSRALRGSKAVSQETRARIQQIAKDLNYRVDKNASSLRSQHANTLALLFFEDPAPDGSHINPFFLSMLGQITRQCALKGYDLLISFQQLSGDWHTDYQDSHRADGLILLGYGEYQQYRKRLTELVEQGTHFVRWGMPSSDEPGLTLGSDNYSGGKQATQHLLNTGRNRIAFIGTANADAPEFEARCTGYRDALSGAGICCDPGLQHNGFSSEATGKDAVEQMLTNGTAFDAIFAASDLIAIGAMKALKAANIDIPGDVSVVGFDDIPAASMTSPPLSSIAQDLRHAGEALVDALIRQIDGEDVSAFPIGVELKIRESSMA